MTLIDEKPAYNLPLHAVDLDRKLAKDVYEPRLAELQTQLMRIQQAYMASGSAGVIVFEGWDASGKGGTIRRMSSALDPRSYKVWPIGAPRPYHKDRHYLLRFMERMPPRGAISAFDRSWYGRVLVERVEALTPETRWRQAYREITDFERMLIDDGVRIAKLFFHVSPDVQLRRFEQRLRDPLKRYKLSLEDFRNRNRWADYEAAVDEMVEKTGTDAAPWRMIPANDKKFARIASMQEIVDKLGTGLDLRPPKLDAEILAAARDHLTIDPELEKSLTDQAE
ncbi:polyphosphate kinase [Fulvimarina sp. MAC8]|uniref:polyphosphate kinase 2 family protein n=1 Tax=Fulvimarina sp. MAC8 TaxID=3162874 RepID=UPI0032EC76AA